MSTCPNSDLYSAYVDAEIPSPWNEKLEAHIASCSKCAERTERYTRLHQLLTESNTEPSLDLDASFSRLMARRSTTYTQKKLASLEWVHKSIRIPLPAIAALFLLAIILPSWFSFRAGVQSTPTIHKFAPGLAALADYSQNDMRMPSSDEALFTNDFPQNKQLTSFFDQGKNLFTVANYARKFSSDTNLFDDAEIVIIRLPNLTRFTGDDQFLLTNDSLIPVSLFNK